MSANSQTAISAAHRCLPPVDVTRPLSRDVSVLGAGCGEFQGYRLPLGGIDEGHSLPAEEELRPPVTARYLQSGSGRWMISNREW